MNTSYIDNLAIQDANIGAFIIWISCGIINCIFSTWNIFVLKWSKPLVKITLHLALQMSVIEIVGGLANAMIGSYHLYYVYRRYPETNTTLNCFLIGGVSYMFVVSSLAFLYLSVSFDRCFSNVIPDTYKFYPKMFKYSLIVPTYFLPVVISLSGFLDVSKTKYTPICILRESLSISGFLLFTYSMLSVSILSVLVYAVNLILLKLKLHRVQISGGNITDVKTKLNSKATKALAANAVLHLLTFTLAAFGNILVTFFYDNGASLGTYFVPAYHLGGVTSFAMYYIFQNQFRKGCKEVMRRCLRKSSNNVINLLDVPSQTVFNGIQTKTTFATKRTAVSPSNDLQLIPIHN